jgi:hypothetical protein
MKFKNPTKQKIKAKRVEKLLSTFGDFSFERIFFLLLNVSFYHFWDAALGWKLEQIQMHRY